MSAGDWVFVGALALFALGWWLVFDQDVKASSHRDRDDQ